MQPGVGFVTPGELSMPQYENMEGEGYDTR